MPLELLRLEPVKAHAAVDAPDNYILGARHLPFATEWHLALS